jgi:hypothetical protein
LGIRARCYLAARGVPESRAAMAGALLEADRDILLEAVLRTFTKK